MTEPLTISVLAKAIDDALVIGAHDIAFADENTARAILSTIEAHGYRIVPEKPTLAMESLGMEAEMGVTYDGKKPLNDATKQGLAIARAVYRAMISTSPKVE